MEPNHNNFAPSSELPQPLEVDSDIVPETKQVSSIESQTVPNVQPQPSATNTSLQSVSGSPITGLNLQTAGQSVATGGTQHLIADDADLIEKEWVTKAKAIVAHTKDDPYQQNREMTKVKADYLKKRYNKDLKVIEG